MNQKILCIFLILLPFSIFRHKKWSSNHNCIKPLACYSCIILLSCMSQHELYITTHGPRVEILLFWLEVKKEIWSVVRGTFNSTFKVRSVYLIEYFELIAMYPMSQINLLTLKCRLIGMLRTELYVNKILFYCFI